jgi:glycosyltransferase involved in cell wall biosynthesis
MASKVVVLMSTFNGEAFLREQIASILSQTVAPTLIVRDDGSDDETCAILGEQARAGRLQFFRGQTRLGARASFLHLIGRHTAGADYVAFADQDDVWAPDKLERALCFLARVPARRPALYCSRLTVTDERLVPIGMTPLWPRAPAFGNALVENIVSGCTCVLNAAAAAVLRNGPAPRHARFHDWWCYLVISALGDVIYDSAPTLLYRQHRNNVVGIARSAWRRGLRRLSRQLHEDPLAIILRQARDFARCHGAALAGPHADTLHALTEAGSRPGWRRRLVLDTRIFRQHAIDDLLLRLRFAAAPWPA